MLSLLECLWFTERDFQCKSIEECNPLITDGQDCRRISRHFSRSSTQFNGHFAARRIRFEKTFLRKPANKHQDSIFNLLRCPIQLLPTTAVWRHHLYRLYERIALWSLYTGSDLRFVHRALFKYKFLSLNVRIAQLSHTSGFLHEYLQARKEYIVKGCPFLWLTTLLKCKCKARSGERNYLPGYTSLVLWM